MKNKLTLALALTFFITAGPALAADYTVDAAHTTVSFKIRHLFSNVVGEFKQFEGTFSYDPNDSGSWKAEAVVQAASIDTNTAKRDEHLKSKDFFDAATHPTLAFKSTGVRNVKGDRAKLDGILTIRGVSKPITLSVKFHGEGNDPWGNTRLGLTAMTKVNRKDFGLIWNQTLETGKLLVGEEVEIILEIEGIKK